VAAGWQQIPVFGKKQQKTTSSLSISGGYCVITQPYFGITLPYSKLLSE